MDEKQVSRRVLLKNGALAVACAGAAGQWGPSFLRSAALAAGAEDSRRKGKILICIFQRGAADGLSMVAPFGDEHYYKLRNQIALPKPSKTAGEESPVDLDGFFAFHRALRPLEAVYRKGELAVVHACGSHNPTRSHFDAQDFMEAGVLNEKSTPSGWLNRALLAAPAPTRRSPFRGVAMTSAVPRSLIGDHEVLAIPDLKTFGLTGLPESTTTASGGFEGLYDEAVDQALHGAGKDSFDAMRLLKQNDPQRYTPAHGAKYPADGLGRSLMQIAQLIKADVGVQVAFAESGGWDTHANQGATSGQLAGRLSDFAKAIAAMHADLGDRMQDVVILTMTEFGRSVRQNGNNGTDHGHGGCFLAIGPNVNGGKVHGKWPGLAPEQLFEGRDLPVTTDYRDLFAEVARKHLGVEKLNDVFPKFSAKRENEPGVLRA
jgi:uncharacterized protein (DUF1501 family)